MKFITVLLAITGAGLTLIPWAKVPYLGEINGLQNGALNNPWLVEFRHIDGSVKKISMEVLKDLKDVPEVAHFSGTVIYQTNLIIDKEIEYLNLGKVHGISELKINEKTVERNGTDAEFIR